jgi:uncharacterized membrane protein YdfJ with MMPL/SSD domain
MDDDERKRDAAAVMQLLGRANWWLPRWLDRILPRLDPEPVGAGSR